MEEQIGSAVVTEVVGRATSFVTGKSNNHKSVDERIDRLEMLLIKIKSAVQVSEEIDINIEPLHEWQDKLKEALYEGDGMLSKFKEIKLEGGQDNSTWVHPAGTLRVDMEAKLRHATNMKHLFYRLLRIVQPVDSPWPAIIERLSEFARVLDPRTTNLLNPLMLVNKYLENDEKVSKLIKTVEKLEKVSGDIGDFIELLKLQSKQNTCRKRKRNAHRGVSVVLSPDLPTGALLCFVEDIHLLFKLFFQIMLAQLESPVNFCIRFII